MKKYIKTKESIIKQSNTNFDQVVVCLIKKMINYSNDYYIYYYLKKTTTKFNKKENRTVRILLTPIVHQPKRSLSVSLFKKKNSIKSQTINQHIYAQVSKPQIYTISLDKHTHI